jgi:hypothetical protein
VGILAVIVERGVNNSVPRRHFILQAIVICSIILAAFSPLVASAEEAESPIFSQVSEAENHTVGWIKDGQGHSSGDLFYPSANGSGDWADMAANGSPFPVLFFFVDDEETLDNYDWISQTIASAGYIVCVLKDDWDPSDYPQIMFDMNETLNIFSEQYDNYTESESMPAGFKGGFDLDHWGVSGHGKGAANALVVNGNWNNGWQGSNETLTHASPRALFGLGLDKSNLETFMYQFASPPNPQFAMFFTGTVDEIAPPNQHIIPVLEDWPGAWHLQEVLGANHLQYQDENSWLAGFSDGTPTISRSEQHSEALAHIIPYLDLILKGDHDSWIEATSRETDINMPSDNEAYISEILDSAHLLFTTSLSPANQILELGQTALLYMDVMHRNGELLLPDDPGLAITCFIIGSELEFSGSLDWANANASCTMNLDELPPGYYQVGMKVTHNGMPATQYASIVRNNTPLVAVNPTPYISLDQHSSVVVNSSVFAYDPDGQDVYFSNASWVGNLGDEMSIVLNGPNLTILHTGEPEFSGTILISMTFVETGTVDPAYLNITTHVSILPVDDQVQVLDQMPRQEFDEDSTGLSLNLTQWFADPEGGPIMGSVNSSDAGLSAIVVGDELRMTSSADWNGAAIISLSISDGSTNPVFQEVPIVVNPVDDEPRYNASAWNISVDEDSTVEVDLRTLAFDPDGNDLNYSWLGEVAGWSVIIDGQEMTIIPPPQINGEFNIGLLNASDGFFAIAANLTITVNPVADQPQVSWLGDEVLSEMLIVHYSFFDEDFPESHQVQASLDSGAWTQLEPLCTGEPIGVLQCQVVWNTSALMDGSHSISLVVKDGSFSTDSQQFVFTTGVEEVSEDENEALAAIISNPIVWGSFVALFFVAIILRGFRKEGGGADLAQAEQTPLAASPRQAEDVLKEVEVANTGSESSENIRSNAAKGSGGLLDKANRLNK